MRTRLVLAATCLGFGIGLSIPTPAFAQVPEGYAPAQTYGMAAKKPVSSGACAFCPWGALADVVRDAVKSAGWDVQVCHNCSGANSILLPATNKMPPLRTAQQISLGSEPPPYAPVDFGASSAGNLREAYLGLGTFKDGGPYKNLRLIALIESPSYVVVAVKASSGITSLADIKAKRVPVHILMNGVQADTILAYYGITQQDLESWGGGFSAIGAPAGQGRGARGGGAEEPQGNATPAGRGAGAGANAQPRPENRGGRATSAQNYDVYIHANSIMANNPESNLMYQVTQVYELNFLQLPDDLLNKLAEYPYQRVVLPQAYFAGVDRNIQTVGRNGHVVFCRDDAPDSFAYDVAKAMDQHKDMLKWKVLPFSYNQATVAKVPDVPLHPGAARYYREVGYLK